MELVLFGVLAVGLHWWSKRSPVLSPSSSLLYGTWSLVAGAIALAILNWVTLILSGQPWRITWGFALWSAQVAT